MITITITDSMGSDHSKTRLTFHWAWRALMKDHPDLVPTLNGENKNIHNFSITHTPVFGRESYIQLGKYFNKPGMWVWRNL